ncbi:ABC transporter substrate-binding protein, partial [Nonomuraea longicatena]|uniref:ABC transporter substrate-binding protein n=1 Tax=Nonomuraea longicatena TaxID=83682 RepID=UPI0031CFAEC7
MMGELMAELRDVIAKLIRRPAFWRADPPLPMVVVTGENAFDVAAWLAAPFEDGVPNATLREGAHQTVFDLVDRLAGEEDGRLGRPVGGSFLPPPRFPLVQFVLWARRQPAAHGDRETKNQLKDWRRSKYGGDRGVKTAADFVIRAATTWVPVGTLAIWWAGGSADVVGALPWLFGALVALFGTAAQGALSIRGSMFTGAFRRMPVVRRKSLERLHLYTQRVRDATPEQAEQLLVNALCQDLRDAYKKWLIPWPSWGRGLYCLLVLEIDRPDGVNARFLRLLENSAHDAGLFPPMLVLAAGPGADVPAPERPAPVPLDEFPEELARWRAVARLRVPRLRLALASGGPPSTQSYRFGRLGSQSRAVGYWLVIVALILVPAAGVAWSSQERMASCGGLAWVERETDECVGVVNAGHRTPPNLFIPEIQNLVDRIDANNAYAVDSGKYVSVVVLGEYSIRKSAENDTRLAGVLSELTAAEEYQRATSSTPRVRVLLANAGNEYLHARRAAQLVTELAEADPFVMGVVGFGRSVAGVRQAVEVLHSAKIPMMATTPTADRLGYVGQEDHASPYYFHVGPTNYREAELGARFIKRRLLEDI